MTEWQPIREAPKDKDIIILDNHFFVYRAHWKIFGKMEGWTVLGQKIPTFTNDDLRGWIPFPNL